MSYQYRVVTVFGGNGFIGRHLVRRLARTGALVRVASRHPSQAIFLKTNGAVGQIVPIATNILNDDSVAAAVKDSDLVVNLVGVLYQTRKWNFQAVHAEAPGRIARAAAAAGVKQLVHVSAMGADASSTSAYARSKAAGEEAVRAGFADATILRPSVVFGPEDQFFNRFAAMMQISPVFPLYGGGKTRFQPVYVGDVAEAAMAGLHNPEARGKTFELGGPRVYTLRELIEMTAHEIRRKPWLVPVPWKIAEMHGSMLEMVPFMAPLLTRDQVELLKTDNVMAPGALGLKDLGVTPTAAEMILPTYLERFIVGGRYQKQRAAG